MASAPELITRGFAESDELMSEMRGEAHEILRGLIDDDISEIKLIQEHLHDGIGQLDLRPDAPAADDPAGRGRDMRPGWAEAISAHAVETKTAGQVIGALGTLEDAALAFCRLLERWARGEADPPTAGGTRLGASGGGRERRAGARRARRAARPVPARARGRRRRGTLVVRGAERGGADRLGAGAQPGGRRRLAAPGRGRVPRARRPRPGARRSFGRRRLRREPRIAARSGPACSICARTSSAARRTTCTRSLRKFGRHGA